MKMFQMFFEVMLCHGCLPLDIYKGCIAIYIFRQTDSPPTRIFSQLNKYYLFTIWVKKVVPCPTAKLRVAGPARPPEPLRAAEPTLSTSGAQTRESGVEGVGVPPIWVTGTAVQEAAGAARATIQVRAQILAFPIFLFSRANSPKSMSLN